VLLGLDESTGPFVLVVSRHSPGSSTRASSFMTVFVGLCLLSTQG